MSELMSSQRILDLLSSQEGLRELVTYGSTVTGHAHLTQTLAATSNTFVRAMLETVVIQAAVQAIEANPEVLTFRNMLKPDVMPSYVPPRPAPRLFVEAEILDELDRIVAGERLTKRDREDLMETFTYGSFARELERPMLYGQTNTSSLWSFWSAYDALDNGNNERFITAKTARSYDRFFSFLLTHENLHKTFVTYGLGRSQGDWSDFLAYGGATAGVLATVASTKTCTPEAWAVVAERAKSSIRDTLVMAAAHPSLPEREQAVNTVEAQVPYLLAKEDCYDVAETIGLLPRRVTRHLLPSIEATLADAWHEDEYRAWLMRRLQWSPTKDSKETKSIEKPRKRWWQ